MPKWELHELALFALGLGTCLALLIRAGPLHHLTLELGLVTILFAIVILILMSWPDAGLRKARLVVAYVYVFWFYAATARIVPALGVPLRDHELLAVDLACLGGTPAQWFQRWTEPMLTDVMSICYLSYHGYLSVALLHALWMPIAFARRFGAYLFLAFAIGLPGYMLVPAIGPAAAFPDLFSVPLEGGFLTRLNAIVVAKGSSVYDVFPSLHVLISCVLLSHDWRHARRRFWIVLLPVGGLVASTLYLRYHYAVDLAAGLAIFLLLFWWRSHRDKQQAPPADYRAS